MLIGLPGSGKSTWRREFQKIHNETLQVWLSTDDFIEKAAKDTDSTYNDVFMANIKLAERNLENLLTIAIRGGKDIVWDQTNLNPKTRAKKLGKVPKDYIRKAVIFLTPNEIIDKINIERTKINRHVPFHILESMKKQMDISKIDEEGFDEIIYVERKPE